MTAITVLDVANARGVKATLGGIAGEEFDRVGLPMIGGCCVCQATIAAYNAYPGRNGYLHCADCIEADGGFATVEEFEQFERECGRVSDHDPMVVSENDAARQRDELAARLDALLNVLNQDKDGDYFISAEAADVIEGARTALAQVKR